MLPAGQAVPLEGALNLPVQLWDGGAAAGMAGAGAANHLQTALICTSVHVSTAGFKATC